jgi:AAA domain
VTLRDLHAQNAAGDTELWADELSNYGIDVEADNYDDDTDSTPTETPDDRLTNNAYTSSQVCDLPPPTFLVDGLLSMPGESVIYSPPKRGKTFLGIDLGLSVGSGRPFMGRTVTPGPVAFIAAEGVGGLGARVQAWHDWHERSEYVEDMTFIAVTVNLMDPKAVLELCAFLKARGVVLTILDTLHRCAPGADENSAKDMGRIIESLDQLRNATGGHVCVIHHAGKDVTKGMRGSSALLGAVDTVIELSGDTGTLRVAVTAQKETEPAPPWWCRLKTVGASAVLEHLAGQAAFTEAHLKILDALKALPPEDRTSTKWQAMAEDAGVGRSAFFQAKKALIEDGRVTGGGGRGALYQIAEKPEKVDDEPF